MSSALPTSTELESWGIDVLLHLHDVGPHTTIPLCIQPISARAKERFMFLGMKEEHDGIAPPETPSDMGRYIENDWKLFIHKHPQIVAFNVCEVPLQNTSRVLH